MGRKKIKIEKISNTRNRQVTFMKRKNGLLKKAMELSVLCDCEVALVVVSKQGKVVTYASHGVEETLLKYKEATKEGSESYTNDDYDRCFAEAAGRNISTEGHLSAPASYAAKIKREDVVQEPITRKLNASSNSRTGLTTEFLSTSLDRQGIFTMPSASSLYNSSNYDDLPSYVYQQGIRIPSEPFPPPHHNSHSSSPKNSAEIYGHFHDGHDFDASFTSSTDVDQHTLKGARKRTISNLRNVPQNMLNASSSIGQTRGITHVRYPEAFSSNYVLNHKLNAPEPIQEQPEETDLADETTNFRLRRENRPQVAASITASKSKQRNYQKKGRSKS